MRKIIALLLIAGNTYALSPSEYHYLKSRLDVNGEPVSTLTNTASGYMLIVSSYDTDGRKNSPVGYIISKQHLMDQIQELRDQISDIQSIIDDVDLVESTTTLQGLKVFK